MKMTLSLVSLNLFIFITTHSLLSTASDVIYDSAGDKLLTGVPYYIFPLLRGTGGGLTLSRATKDSCPLDVTQEPFEFNYGVPFIVTPIIFDETYIRESYPVSIEASFTDPCQGSKTLKLSSSEVVTAAAAKTVKTVTAGGQLNTQESCFQFVEDEVMPGTRSYQIQLCPFKCGSNSSTSLSCYNIGLVTNSDGKTFLGQTDALFPVVFQNSFGSSVQQTAVQSE
ncbi:kunitz trypsin inhibitor 5-like [Bidens hawaiensis]|uniref:kunitz trypsin inhibitor 5-like n=1 Tax=Bidens hawaiensis TaxID=980011 RepID=UPI00404A12F3